MKAYKDPQHKERMRLRRQRQQMRNAHGGVPDSEVLRTWVKFWREQHAKSVTGSVRRKRARAMGELLAMDGETY